MVRMCPSVCASIQQLALGGAAILLIAAIEDAPVGARPSLASVGGRRVSASREEVDIVFQDQQPLRAGRECILEDGQVAQETAARADGWEIAGVIGLAGIVKGDGAAVDTEAEATPTRLQPRGDDRRDALD